jgi:anti-sigma factor RsiW
MSTCPKSSRLSLYHDGQLRAEQRGQIEEHLITCAECAAELDDIRYLSEQLAEAVLPPAPHSLIRRLHACADRLDQLTLARFVRRLTAIAAAVFLIAAIYMVRAQQSPARPAVELTPWEQKAIAPEVDLTSAGGESQFFDFLSQDLLGDRP